jgi:hypothetical protein
MPVFRTCCTFLCLQLGATRIHDSEVALVQERSQVRSAQLLAEDEDEGASAEKPPLKAAKVPPQAPLQKVPHAATRSGVASNMATGASVVARDEDDAMRLYNMKEQSRLKEIPKYGCIYNVTPDPSLVSKHSPGVLFRYAERMEAVVPHAIARWGLSVAGWETGNGFIKLPGWQHRYLPLRWDGKPVLRCTDDWSPGSYGGYLGGTLEYTESNMVTLMPQKVVPVKVLRKGTNNNTYDVRVQAPGMPEYDVPNVPEGYLNPPPRPVPNGYRSIHAQPSPTHPGCFPYDEGACRYAALEAGLKIGGKGRNFTGSYRTYGCFAYKKGYYKGYAFYGTGGTEEQEKAEPRGNKFRPEGHDCMNGKMITLNIKEPTSSTTTQVSIHSNVGMNEFFDKVCAMWGYYRGWMCRKRCVFMTPKKEVNENIVQPAVMYSSDTPHDLGLVEGDTITVYRWMTPPVPEPL